MRQECDYLGGPLASKERAQIKKALVIIFLSLSYLHCLAYPLGKQKYT